MDNVALVYLNRSIVTINTKFQLYIYIYIAISYLVALQGPSRPQVCAKEDNVGKHIRLY